MFALIAIIFAGEMIFSLPFHVTRFFRPVLLDVLNLSNTDLGDVFAVYGVIAMLAYFPGGIIADSFSARKLMFTSLIATAAGGLYFLTLPSVFGLTLLFAYWGVTTILLFFAAMIKVTRDWGKHDKQGVAFGVLDGGRGLVASVFATFATLLLSSMLAGVETNSVNQVAAFKSIVIFYTSCTVLSAILIWFFVKDTPATHTSISNELKQQSKGIKTILLDQKVWLQGFIVIAAYCGYKALDNYGVYAVQVLGMNNVEASELTTYASYTRPIVAVIAGLIVDRWLGSKLVLTLFIICCAVYIGLGGLTLQNVSSTMLIGNLLVTFVGVYGLRAIYFTLIEESGLSIKNTGKAVGLISVLGFTPDIFFASVTGRILDANPGALGFQHYFWFVAFMLAIGMVCTWLLNKINAKS